jgi:mannosyl-3-phosphoglycerate phosphatase
MGNHDKGMAVKILESMYERWKGPVSILGLGDSLNDLPLLKAVDCPVLVRKENGSYDERINIPDLYRTQSVGPAGWSEAVMRWLLNEES